MSTVSLCQQSKSIQTYLCLLFRIPKMSKLNVFPNALQLDHEKHDLIERYPDIDYEMIPVKDQQNVMINKDNQFFFNQLPKVSTKNILRNTTQFKVVKRPVLKIASHNPEHNSNKTETTCIAISSKLDLIVLIPFEQVHHLKETRKYSKIVLKDGQVLKTAIPFKKLEKKLFKHGFVRNMKSHLIRNQVSIHFSKAYTPD